MPMPNPRQHLTKKSEENNRIMLPRRMATAAENNNNSNVARLNAAFVADNRIREPWLKLKMKMKNVDDEGRNNVELLANSISVSGNIEAETNKLELVDNDEFDKYKSGEDSSASASSSVSYSIVSKDRLTMENNEETEELKNLNESLSLSLPSPTPTPTPTPTPKLANNVDKIDEAVQVEVDAERLTATVFELSTAANEEDVAHANKFQKIVDEENIYYNNEQVKELESHSNRDREDMTESESSSSSDEQEILTGVNYATVDAEWPSMEWADLANSKHVVNNFEHGEDVDVDVDESQEFYVPVDLSNDIKVNDYAAAQNMPYNPDAEFIVVTSNVSNNADSSMPMFEKLSMK